MTNEIYDAPDYVSTNGIKMAVYEAGPAGEAKGVPVVFLHGFPELAYSWRHQLPALAAAGYRAMAPDQRGNGLTDAPAAIEDYDMQHLTDDLVGLLDAKGVDKAVFCGHDWGAFITWALPFYCPERLAGLIALNIPLMPRTEVPPIQRFNEVFGEANYINFFQNPGDGEALLDADPERVIRFMMRHNMSGGKKAPDHPPSPSAMAFIHYISADESLWPGEPIPDETELAFYAETFKRTGFRGILNWYRNFDRNWHDAARFYADSDTPQVPVPCLMILADEDFICPPYWGKFLPNYCPDLEMHTIEGCGHWTQQEKPDEVNRLILDWLGRRFG